MSKRTDRIAAAKGRATEETEALRKIERNREPRQATMILSRPLKINKDETLPVGSRVKTDINGKQV